MKNKLNDMLQSLIDDNAEKAQIDFHEYLVNKMSGITEGAASKLLYAYITFKNSDEFYWHVVNAANAVQAKQLVAKATDYDEKPIINIMNAAKAKKMLFDFGDYEGSQDDPGQGKVSKSFYDGD